MRTLDPAAPTAPPAIVRPSRAAREPTSRLTSGRLEAALIVGLVLVYLALLTPALTRWPPVNNDEGREANLYWVAAGIDPAAQRMNAYKISTTWGTGGLQGATSAVIFKVSDWLNLPASLIFQGRLTSLLWSGLLLLVVYWLGRYYFNRAVGLAAAVLLAASNPFLLSSHTLRPDVQIITLTLTAVALVEFGLDRARRWPLLLAGLLLGLSFDTHMNTLTLMPLVGAVLLVRYRWSVWRQPAVWLVLAGLGLGALYYLAVRVMPDPAGFFEAARYWIGIDKRPPGVEEATAGPGGPLAALELELLRYADYFGLTPRGIEEPGELVVILFGLGAGLWRALRGSRPERSLLLGLLLTFGMFVFAVRMKSQYYMLLSFPIYALLIARGFERLAAGLRPPLLAQGALLALVLFTVIGPLKFEDRAWDNFVLARRYRAGQEYYSLTTQLREMAGPEAKILAPPLYWFGFHDHRFVDIFVYDRVRRQRGETAEEFVETVRPDFVIADAKISSVKGFERELYRALDARATPELVVRHKSYGDILVYRLSWK